MDNTALYHCEKINIFSTNQVQKSVFHKDVTGEFPLPIFGSTCDVTGNVVQFKMAYDSNFEELLRGENGLW